ncbi:MAG TPA: tetratricopeptide repeat protein [Candidatus Angelobacter sp.]
MRILYRVAVLVLLTIGCAAGADTDATSLLKAGKADQAIHELNTAIAHEPNNAQAYNLLSRVYYQLELWDNAIRMAEKAVALAPQNSGYHLWLGRAMGRKAEDANPVTAFNLARKVRTEFERAVALDGDNLPARADLSEYYLEAPGFLGGDKNKANQQADHVARTNLAMASYMYARVQEKQGNSGAEAAYKKAIASSSAPAHYWVELAHFYRRTGRLADMESAVNQAVSLARPGDGTEFDGAALLMHANRNFVGATQMLRHYVSQEETAEECPAFQASYFLGVLLEKQGKKKEAAAEFQSALNMASQYKPARDALARISR